MQTAYCFFEQTTAQVKTISTKGIRVTDRDLDILEFILTMKFSTLEEIHSKFFKLTRFGEASQSLIWARQRVYKLIKNELIQVLTESCHRPLYILTQKGYLYLKNSRMDKTYCRPLTDVDGRTLVHDMTVTQLRIELEDQGLVNDWISERQLSEDENIRKYLSAEFRPDALYTSPESKKIAFELEIARKSKERYQQKIKRYIQVMTESAHGSPIFDSVHFVCESIKVLDLIKDQTQLFQPLFKFNLTAEILK